MSTNKTPNYALHSWLPTDDFRLSEVNANFAALDAVTTQILWGTYIGDSVEAGQLIDLGQPPFAVLVFYSGGANFSNVDGAGLALRDHPAHSDAVTLTDAGFRVRTNGIYLNAKSARYYYLAFC